MSLSQKITVSSNVSEPLHVIKRPSSVTVGEELLLVCCMNVQTLGNETIPMANYVVRRSFCALALSERRFDVHWKYALDRLRLTTSRR